ncbi:MAG: glycosyltransferase [Porphyromonadaceae bacterium]|nr:glycosyltransferase [Porphyromonadaceae bacterium]
MKRVLILCDLYPPAFAPRVAYLTQYLRSFGWQPIVFTEQVETHQLFADFPIPCPVYRVGLRPERGWERALTFALEIVAEYKERSFARTIQSYMQEHGLMPPDAILCMTYRKFPLRSAQTLARLWGVPWLADCRDLVEQYSDGDFLPRPIRLGSLRLGSLERLLARRFIHLRNRALASARGVITVSEWHRVLLSRVHPSVSIIYNGYDHKLFAPKYPSVETFRIVFTGRLLSLAMRDPSLLLEALASDELQSLPLAVDFYTDDYSSELLRSLPAFVADPRCRIHAMVPSRQVPSLLAEASIILLLGNAESGANGPNGMVSTKLFEALAMQKPTLLLPDSSGEAAQILSRSGCGIASGSKEEIINFVLQHYTEWVQMGFTAARRADDQYIQQFSRRRQAQQFAGLLDQITE